MTDIEAQFAELFDGRVDAYGTDTGGCVRGPALDWDQLYYEHLRGVNPIGIYPLVPWECGGVRYFTGVNEWRCRWGCVDLDVRTDKKPSGDYSSEDECHIAAVNLQKVLTHMGVASWIERTRSSGRHVWIFTESWASAQTMRRALLVACSVAGCSTREINPKSKSLAEGAVGNYVRLPYPGALKHPGLLDQERYIINPSLPNYIAAWPLEMFVRAALDDRTPIATLEHIASLYKEADRVLTNSPSLGDLSATDRLSLGARLNALAKHLYDKPVDQIADRSMHIEAFVRAAKDSGLTASETLTLADELAARCGKFDGRRDREDQLRRIVERAWT